VGHLAKQLQQAEEARDSLAESLSASQDAKMEELEASQAEVAHLAQQWEASAAVGLSDTVCPPPSLPLPLQPYHSHPQHFSSI